MLYKCLRAVCVNKRSVSRQVKKVQRAGIGVVTAASVLLNCRNKFMCAHQTLTALTLKRSACGKRAFKRLNARFLSISYFAIIRKQIKFGQNHDQKVKEWAQTVKDDVKTLKDLDRKTGDRDRTEYEKVMHNRHPGYRLVGDNVDLLIKPRQTTIGSGNQDIHYYNMMAVKNRISGNHLDDAAPIGNIETTPWSVYIPTIDDNKAIRTEFRYLVTRVIAEYIPQMSWLNDYIPPFLSHKYSQIAKEKTEVVCTDDFFSSVFLVSSAASTYFMSHSFNKIRF